MRIALDHPDKIGGLVVISGQPNRFTPSPVDKTKPATLQERWRNVHEQRVPFFKTVTPETWSNGMLSPQNYCQNPVRAKELRDESHQVPVPTILRYFLEYLTADVTPELKSLKMPSLVINPISDTVPEDKIALMKKSTYWTFMAPSIPIEYIEKSRVFVMEDQPDLLDKTISAFVESRLKNPSAK
jgi:pimeloyl-ACP methyl ester carboxylesterase